MTDTLKFPFEFNIEKMQKEVLAFRAEEWVPHFNKGYYSGDWSAIPLRSVGGNPLRIFPDPSGTGKYMDTPHLSRCPYLQTVLGSLECEKIDVRLLRLKAGSEIREHSDYDLSFEDGEVRLHIPVMTNPKMEFYLNGKRVVMKEGECWYLNLNLMHRVANRGLTDRIHLVIDCRVNPWLEAFFRV